MKVLKVIKPKRISGIIATYGSSGLAVFMKGGERSSLKFFLSSDTDRHHTCFIPMLQCLK